VVTMAMAGLSVTAGTGAAAWEAFELAMGIELGLSRNFA
jgi:hypothetical protein